MTPPAVTLGCALHLAARVVDAATDAAIVAEARVELAAKAAARRVRNAVAPLWWGWLIHR